MTHHSLHATVVAVENLAKLYGDLLVPLATGRCSVLAAMKAITLQDPAHVEQLKLRADDVKALRDAMPQGLLRDANSIPIKLWYLRKEGHLISMNTNENFQVGNQRRPSFMDTIIDFTSIRDTKPGGLDRSVGLNVPAYICNYTNIYTKVAPREVLPPPAN